MKIKPVKVLAIVFLSGFILNNAYAQKSSRGAKPNVILIYSDDYNTKSGYNHDPHVKTPNLDKLAAKAVNLKNAFVQYPLCSPSRTSLLSGKRPSTTGITDNNTTIRTYLGNTVFLPQLFKQNGYYVAQVGKIFHSSAQLDEAGKITVDFNLDSASWTYNFNEGFYVKNEEVKHLAHSPYRGKRGPKEIWKALDATDEETGDGIVAAKAASLIDERAKDKKPFFLAVGFRRPHTPYDAPKKYFDLYKNANIEIPSAPSGDHEDIPAIALTKRDTLTNQETIDRIKAYYASISFMDAQVGKVLSKLDQHKLWENTIVVFLGDHGYHNAEHLGLWHKMTQFEESTHGNLLVAAPGTARGQEAKGFVEYVDVYPTIADLAGLKAPADLEGKSFAPLLFKPSSSWKSAVFSEVIHDGVKGRTVRIEGYRYTEWGSSAQVELYDLKKDPKEFSNVAGKSEYAQIQEKLRNTLSDGWRKTQIISVTNEKE